MIGERSPGGTDRGVDELRFEAMGTFAHVIVVGGVPGAADQVRRRVDDLEAKWSRFRHTSELSILNAHAGELVRVSAETRLLLQRGIEGWHLTGGAFDPTVLGAVLRAGYDRTFAELDPRSAGGHSLLELGCEGILIEGDRARLPDGTGFDSGGIGKGLAADLASIEAIEAGAGGVCVNLGGDIRVRGAGAGGDGAGWTVGIEHPGRTGPLALLGLADGAVATSTTLKRTWLADGERRHHLIDPRSGLPADGGMALATVVDGEGWRAEVLAKAVLLNGGPRPFDILGGTGAEGIAVDREGGVVGSEGLARFLGGVELPGRIGP